MNKYLLKLYIVGRTMRSQQAVANIQRICELALKNQYELHIIDVLDQPGIAEQEKILATPTLIKESPLPIRRIIGDLSNQDQVLLGLGL